jgi:radical SAM superfamily enzyme YgiQ (UPF0313 family)
MNRTVQFVQINNSFGSNHFLPYTSAILQTYVRRSKTIEEYFQFQPFIYMKEDLDAIMDKIGSVDILCLSCYIWNWNISMEIARRARDINPACTIIVGGPQIPADNIELMNTYGSISFAIHGEGEETLKELLEALADYNYGLFKNIGGLSYRAPWHQVVNNPKREPIADLNTIPSPYLFAAFNDMVKNHPMDINYVASWETSRGCPYTCTYCDWGTNSPRIRKFDDARLEKEMEWFANNRVELLFSCDSNFGIDRRDVHIVDRLGELKRQYGFPKTFRACNAKNSNGTIFEIERKLVENGMSKGASLSMQSLSPKVLENIRRHNISIDMFFELQKTYMKSGMSTYTELIMALPGETYDSYVDGMDILLTHGQHQQINVYNCSMMVNSEMYKDEYRRRHGIRTVKIPLFMMHSCGKKPNEIIEHEEIVVGTNTMSVDDWKRTYIFSWAVQCFHFLGLTQLIALFFHGRYGMKYRDFYEDLVRFALSYESHILKDELLFNRNMLDEVLKGKGFDQFVDGCGDVSWPMEEASFIRLTCGRKRLYEEIFRFLMFLMRHRLKSDADLFILNELVNFQKDMVIGMNENTSSVAATYNFHEYIQSIKMNEPVEFIKSVKTYEVSKIRKYDNLEEFAREIVWYGRKGGKFLKQIKG